MVVLAVALFVALLALGVCAFEVWGLPYRRRRCLVSIRADGDNGGALEGILWSRRGPWIVLKSATYIDGGSEVRRTVDGDVLVEKARINFIQVF